MCRAEADRPAEIKAAWQRLESKLPTLRGRKFYGLCYEDPSESVYYAALHASDPDEEAALGFPGLVIHGGKYASAKLMDWPKHAKKIPALFDQFAHDVQRDPARPNIEFYRSQTELHLLVPVAE